MPILPWNPKAGGNGGGKVTGDYKFTQDASGDLVLNYKGSPVSSMGPNGSWFTDNISTGVGSLHLGGNESGGVAHSVSSAGQNVGFKNEFSVADPQKKWFFFPAWQAVTVDGTARQNAKIRSYDALNTNMLPNGSQHASIVVNYDFSVSFGLTFEVYAVTVLAGESYNGKLRNSIVSNVTGAEIYDTTVSVSIPNGSELKIDYKYPFSVRSGDNMNLRLLKEDGSPLRVRAGTVNTTQPWRRLSAATFSDQDIQPAITGAASTITASNLTANRLVASDSSGKIVDSASAGIPAGRPVVLDANSRPAGSLATNDELANIRGGVTRDTTATIVDGDGFVFNDGGTMIQIAASQVAAYTNGKITGAASGIITTNLTASRAVASDASGKVSAATTTLAEINNVAGGVTRDTSTTIVDGDGFVFNDGGTMKQIAASQVSAYTNSKITGAVSDILTTNLTGSRILASNVSGKIFATSASSTLLNNLSNFVGVSGFVTQVRPASGSALYSIMTASIRTISITWEVTPTESRLNASQDAASGMRVIRSIFTGSSASSGNFTITSGGNVVTLSGSATTAYHITEGLILADGSTTDFINFRAVMFNPVTTAAWLKFDVW